MLEKCSFYLVISLEKCNFASLKMLEKCKRLCCFVKFQSILKTS